MYALIELISILLSLLTYAIIIRAIMSWFRPNPRNSLVRLVHRVTDPVLRPLENIIPPIGGIDFTPLIAIILLQLAQSLLPALVGAY